MKMIIVSEVTQRRIRNHAEGDFHETAKRLGNGLVQIPVSDDVAESIEQILRPGETVDQCLARVLSGHERKKP